MTTGGTAGVVALTLVLSLLATPFAAAQQAGKIPRIGWLGNMSPPPLPDRFFDAFRQGLRDLGYVEGRNIIIESRWAEGKLERLPPLAAELVRLKVDVMMVSGDVGIQAAKQAGTIPVVGVVCDPVENLRISLSGPGGSATGLTCISAELAAKRLELLKEAVPKLARVALLYNPADPNKVIEAQQSQDAARSLGLSVSRYEVREAGQFQAVFTTMRREGMQALVTLADPFMNFQRGQIAGLAAQHRLPAMYGFREYVDVGGLVSYGANLQDEYRHAAVYVDKILKGAKPADLPVEQPMKFELIFNLKTAKALGLTIPPSLLARTDEVIQ